MAVRALRESQRTATERERMKAIICLCATFALGVINFIQPVKNEKRPLPIVSATETIKKVSPIKPQTKVHPSNKPVERKVVVDSGVQKKIAGLIKLVQPRKGQSYADHVANIICQEAKRYNIDPYIIATTAYIESEFSMASRPCIGIMQVERRTYRALYAKSGLKPNDLEDNIRLGAWELADKAKNRSQSRIALASRGELSRMWGRYNGAGPKSSYVRKAHLVYSRIKNKSVTELQTHLKKRGPLWKN